MTTRIYYSSLNRKKKKRKRRMLAVKSAIRLTRKLIRKFWEITMTENDESCPPPKKRKLAKKSDRNDTEINSIQNVFASDSSFSFREDKESKKPLHKFVTPQQPRGLVESTMMILNKSFRLFKKIPRNKIKSTLKSTALNQKEQNVTIQELLLMFRNCVNFVQPRGCAPIEDIDLIVRSFSHFGKVLSIQDHWIRPRGYLYPCIWVGASVTYGTEEEYNRALRTLSITQTSLVGVSVVNHLHRISLLESLWTSMSNNCESSGTCIVVEGTSSRTSRMRLRGELARYGIILDFKWRALQNVYEVTYLWTVNAVAAALALDGRSFMRCRLRTKIKITEKELFIHRKMQETF